MLTIMIIYFQLPVNGSAYRDGSVNVVRNSVHFTIVRGLIEVFGTSLDS